MFIHRAIFYSDLWTINYSKEFFFGIHVYWEAIYPEEMDDIFKRKQKPACRRRMGEFCGSKDHSTNRRT